MNPEEKKCKYSEAEALFVRNKELDAQGNQESQIKANRDQIWLILDEIISEPYRDGIKYNCDWWKNGYEEDKDIGAITYIIKTYDPSKGPLEYFANSIWEKRKKPTKKKKERNLISIDEKLDPEGNQTRSDMIADTKEHGQTDGKIYLMEESLEHIIDIAIALNELKKDDRRKLVFTDNITELCKNEIEDIEAEILLNRQQSILAGINLQFLDFYMQDMCRTLKEIQKSGLKRWKALREWEKSYFKHSYGRDEYKKIITRENDQEELELPLSNKVYTCFLLSEDSSRRRESVEVSISQYKDRYKTFLKVLGLQNIIKNIIPLNPQEQTGRGAERRAASVSPIRDMIMENLDELNNRNMKAAKDLYEKVNACMEKKCTDVIRCYQYILNMGPDLHIEKEILDFIGANVQADRRLIRDTIRACDQSESKSITIIVKKIQDENLYRYFWS